MSRLPTSSLVALGCTVLLAAGCASSSNKNDDTPAQRTFASAEEAAVALQDGVRSHDIPALREIFGPRMDELGSGDPAQDELDLQRLSAALDRSGELVTESDSVAHVVVADTDWTFPAPIVKERNGRWRFDTAAGIEEVTDRRVGQNELDAIATCRAYIEAQRRYHAMDPDGDGTRSYAARLASSPGQRDGLYWPDAEGAPVSPVGPHVAEAVARGQLKKGAGPQPYRGYHLQILDGVAPGTSPPGYPLIAWPASYGHSGVMSFLVSPDGTIYERDLGKDTAATVEKIKSFDARGWKPVTAARAESR